MESGTEQAIGYYRLAFTAIQTEGPQPVAYTGELLPGMYELSTPPGAQVEHRVHSLLLGKDPIYDIESFHQQLRFQELLGMLFRQNWPSGYPMSSEQAVEQTIRYLQTNYMHAITVKQLAQLANLSHWRYTPLFQEMTGKKPLDFLAELRINRSKELLAHSSAPLRDIARQVGFTDEYYFNRRFRQIAGVTPKQYAQVHRRNAKAGD
jgi:AraC-like DNA-binding protein